MPDPIVEDMLAYNAAVTARLREFALKLDEHKSMVVTTEALVAALIHRLHELYVILRQRPQDTVIRNAFAATSHMITDLMLSKSPETSCKLSPADLLTLIGSSAESA